MCCCIAACSAYRSSLLDVAPRTKTAGLSGGTGGSNGTAGHPAIDASVHDAQIDASRVNSGTPEGGPPQTRCGDGLVTDQETCDIAIEPGQPGACPSDCPPLGACTQRALNGKNTCTAECIVLQIGCKNDDGCCPAGCDHSVDNDCSMSCGNGVVDKNLGETCEPSNPSTPCPTMADCDDKDPCTTDTLTGSPAACNAACQHVPITMLVNGDGCCPMGANANTDNDCQAKCGNGVVEPGEQCDGSTGCSSDCKLTLQPDQIRCVNTYATVNGVVDPCEECSCKNCIGTNDYLACRDSDKDAGTNKCFAVLMCAQKNNCVGTPCYCGDDPTCGVLVGGPAGPCKDVIEMAAGVTNPPDVNTEVNSVTNQRQTAGTPLNLAYVADMCRTTNCSTQCR